MFLAIGILILCTMIFLAVYYAEHSAVSDPNPVFKGRKEIGLWVTKGVLIPLFIWALVNMGSMPIMPPLARWIGEYRAAGADWKALFYQSLVGAWVLLPCWSSLTLVWCLIRLYRRLENKDDLQVALLLWMFGVLFILSVVYLALGGFAVVILTWFLTAPMAMYSLNVAVVRKHAPLYSSAIGKMKFGKYAEAEEIIIKQLENCENDFDGWMMLASLYANQFNDVEEAEKCIIDLCDHPDTNVSQVSVALHLLADFHLVLRKDPVAARRALQMICDRMPGTHLATMASHRINSLPASRADLEEHPRQRVIPLPHHDGQLGLAKPGATAGNQTAPVATAAATECVELLKRDPNDVAAREKLAHIYVNDFGKVEEAIEQMELLIAMPNQDEQKIPHWISTIADWLGQHRGAGEEYRETLSRLIRQYPNSKQSFDAQRRLSLLDAQQRIAQQPRIKIKPPGNE